jgi:NAD(P)-dependent dehydrogenase (short-subunit alcohol dehydrogenase family)
MESDFYIILTRQIKRLILQRAKEMKIIVITGVTSGFGKEWLYELDQQPSIKFFVLARSANKFKGMLLDRPLKNESELILCDFLSMNSIHDAAQNILKKARRVDVLVNNAGHWSVPLYTKSKDGIESTLAVNHIAPFLLTGLLLPLLKISDCARLVNTASFRHKDAKLNQKDIQLKTNFNAELAYCNSKLFNVLFTKTLARKLKDTHISVNCFDPGIVDTPMLSKGMPSWLKLAYPLIRIVVARPPKKGAETGIYLSISDEVKHHTGQYFKDKKLINVSRLAELQSTQEWLWRASVEITQFEY